LRSAQIPVWSRFSSAIRPGRIPLNSSSLPSTIPDTSINTYNWRSAEPYRLAVGEQLPAIRQDAELAKFNNRRRFRQTNHDRQF
jgi:hypothetical protein